jgi:hypothetical protein
MHLQLTQRIQGAGKTPKKVVEAGKGCGGGSVGGGGEGGMCGGAAPCAAPARTQVPSPNHGPNSPTT